MSALDRLTELEREATLGPWRLYQFSAARRAHAGIEAPGSRAGMWLGLTPVCLQRADAAFIAEARNALPALLDVARAAREARDELAKFGAERTTKAVLLIDAVLARLDALGEES